MVDPKPKLKLYHAAPSRSSVARWMLEETGEPYEIELLSLKAGDQAKPSYLAINPMGKVPALVDGDVIANIALLEDRNRFLAVMQGGVVKAGTLSQPASASAVA